MGEPSGVPMREPEDGSSGNVRDLFPQALPSPEQDREELLRFLIRRYGEQDESTQAMFDLIRKIADGHT